MASTVSGLATEFFGYVSVFRAAQDSHRPDADVLRAQLLELLDAFRASAQEAQIADPEIDAAAFALVAWADECILAEKWHGIEGWRSLPLQLQRYGTVRAGNEFYDRLSALQSGQDDALEIFFMCLAMGFKGELALDPERRTELTSQLWQILYSRGRVLAVTDPGELSDAAYTWQFSDQHTGGRRVTPILCMIAVAVGVVYALCFGVIRYWARDFAPFTDLFS